MAGDKNKIGIAAASAVGLGAIIGAGIFVLSGTSIALAGADALFAFILVGIVAVIIALKSRAGTAPGLDSTKNAANATKTRSIPIFIITRPRSVCAAFFTPSIFTSDSTAMSAIAKSIGYAPEVLPNNMFERYEPKPRAIADIATVSAMYLSIPVMNPSSLPNALYVYE